MRFGLILSIALIAIFCGSAYGFYSLGSRQGYQAGYEDGYDAGYEELEFYIEQPC